MDTDCGQRSSQLNLHYRHPHHASISFQRSQNPHSPHNPHNPKPTPRHGQQAGWRQHLRAAPDEGRAAQETSDDGAGCLTRAATTPAPPAGAPTQADLWPGSRQLLVSASINSQHQHSLQKHTLRHQQPPLSLLLHHHLPTTSSTSTSASSNTSISTFASATSFFGTRHGTTLSHEQQRQIHSARLPDHQPPGHITKVQTTNQDNFPQVRVFIETGKPPSPFSHQTAHIAHTDAMGYTNLDSATMGPASPDTPSTVPTLSSSQGENAANISAVPVHDDNNAINVHEAQGQKKPKSTSSPRDNDTSIGSDSDLDIGRVNFVNDSFPEPVPGSGQGAFQNVPTPFHFPTGRRSSATNRVNNNKSAPSQQTQQTPSNVDPAANFGGYFAYCLDRGNDLYTRLIPADLLPPTAGFVALQNDSQGMIVLPDPSTQPSAGMSSPPAPAGVAHVPGVGSGPPFGYAAQPAQQNFGPYGTMQGPPPSSIAPLVQRPGQAGGNNTKKHKVYCDKWVHEGICAFTQQGCKFKHEMPHDRAIQRSLGLFHGYPNWYKKLQPQDQQPLDSSAAAPLALPAPPGLGQSNFFSHHTPFTSSPAYPNYVPACVPAPPPPTPALHLPPTPYQPFFSPFSNTANDNRLRATSSTGIDGHWRASGPNAASWRTPPVSTTVNNGGSASTTTSADHLADSFARSLSMGELLGNAYQTDQSHQQPIIGTSSSTTGPLTGATAFSGFGFGLGGFGRGFGIGRPLGSLGESGGSGGGFGPIGPPPTTAHFPQPGVPSPTSTGFSYRGNQALSDGQGHDSGARNNEWPEDESGHLAAEW